MEEKKEKKLVNFNLIKKILIFAFGLLAIGCGSSMQRVSLDGVCSIEMPNGMLKQEAPNSWTYSNSSDLGIMVLYHDSNVFDNISDYADSWKKRYATYSFSTLSHLKINGLPAVFSASSNLEGFVYSFAIIDGGKYYFVVQVMYSDKLSKNIADKIIRSFKVENLSAIPDNEKTRDELYTFTYQDIPDLANLVFIGKLSPEALKDKNWFLEIGKNVQFSWEGFEVHSIATCSSEIHLILYVFPEPRKSPEAKFALLSIDLKNKKLDYFVLEKMQKENEWLLGGVDVLEQIKKERLQHLNYGQIDYEPTIENFKQDVLRRLKSK